MTKGERKFTAVIVLWVAATVAVIWWTFNADAATMPVPGWRPAIQYTGFDPGPNGDGSGSYTYVPIAGGQFKPEYAKLVADLLRPTVGRDMDLLQGQTNDETTWAGRAATDYGRNGVTRETDIRIANQMRALVGDYVPQTMIPERATVDYARQLGRLWGTMYAGHSVRVSLGNEIWNVYKGNNGEYALIQAKASGIGGDDLSALAQWHGARLATLATAFKDGLRDVARADVTVTPIVEGFSPVTSYAANQLAGMRAAGFNPAALGVRLSIAQYAFGTSTDVAGRPIATDAQKRDAALDFIDKALVAWTLAHRELARANGLVDVVDAYELRLGTKPVDGAAETADWVRFQLTDENAQLQGAGLRRLIAASGGTGAALALEGLYGFPMDAPQGQFPLLAIDQFANPLASGAYRGVRGVIDFGTPIPEPAALALLAGALLLRRWHGTGNDNRSI